MFFTFHALLHEGLTANRFHMQKDHTTNIYM